MMGFNFINFLIIFTISLPLLSALFLGINHTKRNSFWLLVEIGLLLVSLIVLYFLGEQNLSTPFYFMGEEITFSVSSTPILLYLAVLVVLAVFIWRKFKSKSGGLSRFHLILVNIALSFGFIAFLSGQFMIRYIALDVVGLVAALLMIDFLEDKSAFEDFVLIFQVLRLGDLSLLASILLINQGAGTLDISQMISFAIEMPINSRTWVLAGFILAIWIKLAIWPFSIWLQRAQKASQDISFWVSGFLMPVLGYYLLYRISPIIYSHQIFQITLFIISILTILLVTIINGFGFVPFSRFKFLSSVSGSILICNVAINPKMSILFYLLGLILYRLFILLEERSIIKIPNIISLIVPIAVNSIFLWQNAARSSLLIWSGWIGLTVIWILGDWILKNQRKEGKDLRSALVRGKMKNIGSWISNSAEWLNRNIEQGVLSYAFKGSFLISFAHWLHHTVEVGLFTDFLANFSTFFQKFARFNREKIEQRLENSWIWIGGKLATISEGAFKALENKVPEKADEFVGDALKSVEAYEKNVLKKRMRWDLLWIPLILIIIFLFLILV